MRRQHLTQLIGTFVVAAALVGLPTVAFAVIAGGVHDLNSALTIPQLETCVVCHTPHNSDVTETDAPLWNHDTTEATFTLYSSSTMDA